MNKRILKIRKRLELTQKDFGKIIGMKPNSISDIENGKNSVTETVVRLICREFGINEVWLRTGEGGDVNMFTKISDNDRYSLNLGKLTITENMFAQNVLNALAETEPEKLEVIEEFMMKCLGLK